MGKKFVDLANLKSNLENFFSEIISPTFATKEGVSEQLGNHTVKSDVPENAKFTDTVYDDTEVKGSIAELNSNLDKYVLNSDDKFIGGSGQTNYLNIDFSNYDNGIYYIYGKSTDNKILATAHVAVENSVVSIIDRSNPSIVANGSTLTFYTTSWWIDVYVKKINVANGYIGSNIAGINESLSVLGKRISDNGYGEVAGGKNLANPKNFVNNKVVDVSTGAILNNNSYFISDYIEVTPNVTYTKQGFTHTGEHYFYDKDKNPIKEFGTETFIPPENAKYVVLSGIMGNQEIAQLEKGSVATEYEPYFPSNKMLEEKADKKETTVNLLNPTLQTTTQNGVTCTNNGDGTYTLNGTAVSTAYFRIQGATALAKRTTNKTYKLVGCPTGGTNKYDLRYEINGSVANGGGKDFGDGVIIKNDKINSTDITSCEIIIAVMNGITANNLVFKPMVTTNLNATYDDFVPYTGDTGKLNSDVAKLKNDLDKLNALPIGTIIQVDSAYDIMGGKSNENWLIVGKSTIDVDDSGAAVSLVTNVYRKIK